MARLFIIHFLPSCKIATFFVSVHKTSTLSGPPTALLVINEELRLVIKSMERRNREEAGKGNFLDWFGCYRWSLWLLYFHINFLALEDCNLYGQRGFPRL